MDKGARTSIGFQKNPKKSLQAMLASGARITKRAKRGTIAQTMFVLPLAKDSSGIPARAATSTVKKQKNSIVGPIRSATAR